MESAQQALSKAATDQIVTRREKERIPVKLTAQEAALLAVRSVEMQAEHDTLLEEFDALKKQWKKKIETSENALSQTRQAVLSKTEWREVEGDRVYNMTTGQCVFSFDAHEYGKRPISEKERALLREQQAESDLFGEEFEMEEGDAD